MINYNLNKPPNSLYYGHMPEICETIIILFIQDNHHHHQIHELIVDYMLHIGHLVGMSVHNIKRYSLMGL